MLISADQLLAHLIGDYVIQSDYMANEKTKKSVAALCHALSYTVPFLLVTTSPLALAAIAASHFVIDRWRLARYVCWAKNFLRPGFRNEPWEECQVTGYHKDRPMWMTVWLLIIADNTLHILINGLAVALLG